MSKTNSSFWEPIKFIGKNVVDSKGNDCGKIKYLYINPQTFSVSGAKIKKGFSKDYLLTSNYFEKFEKDVLHLNTIPIKPNDPVVNKKGKALGKVKNILRDPETNKIQALEVKSALKHVKIIPIKDLVGVGDKITVN